MIEFIPIEFIKQSNVGCQSEFVEDYAWKFVGLNYIYNWYYSILWALNVAKWGTIRHI